MLHSSLDYMQLNETSPTELTTSYLSNLISKQRKCKSYMT